MNGLLISLWSLNKSSWQIKILSAILDPNIDGKLTPPTPKMKEGKMVRFGSAWFRMDGGLPFHFILSKIIDLQVAYSPADMSDYEEWDVFT